LGAGQTPGCLKAFSSFQLVEMASPARIACYYRHHQCHL